MPKTAISVTLDQHNLVWLKARARAGEGRSVSELLDRILTEARERAIGREVKSVVGTIDIDPSDPYLLKANEAIHKMFPSTLMPLTARETRGTYGKTRRKQRR